MAKAKVRSRKPLDVKNVRGKTPKKGLSYLTVGFDEEIRAAIDVIVAATHEDQGVVVRFALRRGLGLPDIDSAAVSHAFEKGYRKAPVNSYYGKDGL